MVDGAISVYSMNDSNPKLVPFRGDFCRAKLISNSSNSSNYKNAKLVVTTSSPKAVFVVENMDFLDLQNYEKKMGTLTSKSQSCAREMYNLGSRSFDLVFLNSL